MMRRFSRRRRGGSSSDGSIDSSRWFGRILEEKILPLNTLVPLEGSASEGVPGSLAALGSGESESGDRVLVSFAPRSGGDALLGGLVAALRLAEEEQFSGELAVVTPQWRLSDRRKLGLVAPAAFRIRAVEAPTLAERSVGVEPEPMTELGVVPPASVASYLARPADQEIFARASTALEGLASKHGGAVRGFGRSVELVIMARRVAELRADDSGVMLNTVLPQKSSLRLSSDGLAGALDGLEGNLRKRLNDRRTREGDEGMRTRLISLIGEALGLRATIAWPVGGSDLDVLDLLAVNGEGSPVVAASRGSLSLKALGVILDAAVEIRSALPTLLAGVEAPVRFDLLRLALVAKEYDPGVAQVMGALTLGHDLLEIGGGARGLGVSILGSGEAAPLAQSRSAGRRGERGRGRGRGRESRPDEEESGSEVGSAPEQSDAAPEARSEGQSDSAESGREAGGSRGRGRGRGRRSRGGRDSAAGSTEGADAAGESGETGEGEKPGRRPAPRFDEVSAFDLLEDDSRGEGDDSAAGSRRRGRSRRRGGRSRGGEQSESGGDDAPVPGVSRPERREATSASDDVVEEEILETDDPEMQGGLAALPEEMTDAAPVAVPSYEDDDESEPGADAEKELVLERERRRLSRSKAKKGLEAPEEPPKPPRRRVAIVAHADRDSLLGAVLLARDLRLVEGIWVYQQSELMTFFRGVTTDLREETPIYLIGFTPSPARDVIQAAALYRDRLTWIDHHDWPPEDLGGLRSAIGEEFVITGPGARSSLPIMLQSFTRRSRFSDKLVDLAAGRFSEHDYERWGRLWWHRLGELAAQSGKRRNDLDPLLSGRPSDLAKEASRAETPPIPEEVSYVSERDFRLVHFAGHSLVVLEVPEALDLHLAARIARERYGATLSLAICVESDFMSLAGDDNSARRALDCGSMVEHLVDKFAWVEALPDADHVARFRVRELTSKPERIDEVVGAIAMGRSLLDR